MDGHQQQQASADRVRETEVGRFVEELLAAVDDEIRAAVASSPRAVDVLQGRRLRATETRTLYRFRADEEVRLQPETRVELVLAEGERGVPGVLVACSDFDVLVDLEEDVGAYVARARLASDPVFILRALEQRLEALGHARLDDPQARLRLDEPAALDVEPATSRLPELADLEVPESLLGLPTRPGSGAGAPPGTDLAPVGRAGLGTAQAAAVARCLEERFHVVWGPPGTGKTRTVAALVRALVERGERVLLLAHANVAVDVAILRVADVFARDARLRSGQVLRVGHPQRAEVVTHPFLGLERHVAAREPELVAELRALAERLRRQLDDERRARDPGAKAALAAGLDELRRERDRVRTRIRAVESELLGAARVVATTFARHVLDERLAHGAFDAVVVDEASMAPFPHVLLAATTARRRLVLVGDMRQLPPVHVADSDRALRWLGRDAFEISRVRERIDLGLDDPRVTLLDVQHRMARPIGELVSTFAYGGRLRTDATAAERTAHLAYGRPAPGAAVVVVDTAALAPAALRGSADGASRANPLHAAIARTLAARLLEDGVGSVALVAPYRAQARLLAARETEVEGLDAATVHRLQGDESDAVVVDLVDAHPFATPSRLTGGGDGDLVRRLLNVACSRARGKLVLLVDGGFVDRRLRGEEVVPALLAAAAAQGVRISAATLGLDGPVGPGLEWLANWHAAAARLAADVESTEAALVLDLPAGFVPPVALVDALARRPAGVLVRADPHASEALEATEVDVRLIAPPGGVTAILGGVAYLGGRDADAPVARIEDAAFVTVLRDVAVGRALLALPPSAAAEDALDGLFGRCGSCGEPRRPRRRGHVWVAGCAIAAHGAQRLVAADGDRLAEALDVRCPECGGRARAVPTRDGGFRLACAREGAGCPGEPPSLDDLFGPRRPLRTSR